MASRWGNSRHRDRFNFLGFQNHCKPKRLLLERKAMTNLMQFNSVQWLSRVRLFATPWTTAHQASLSINNSWSLPKPVPSESVMASNHLILCSPLLLPPPIEKPASGSFQRSQFFPSGRQSIGVSASASVLPMNIQDWFPLGLTDWISLGSKGLSRVLFSTTVQKHQFFGAQLSL